MERKWIEWEIFEKGSGSNCTCLNKCTPRIKPMKSRMLFTIYFIILIELTLSILVLLNVSADKSDRQMSPKVYKTNQLFCFISVLELL